jgi:hypothetical protein
MYVLSSTKTNYEISKEKLETSKNVNTNKGRRQNKATIDIQ